MASLLLGVVEEVRYKKAVRCIRPSSCQGGHGWPGQSCSPSGVICKDTASVNHIFSLFSPGLELVIYCSV